MSDGLCVCVARVSEPEECACGCVSEECEEETNKQGEKEAVFLNTHFCSLSNPGTADGIKGGS